MLIVSRLQALVAAYVPQRFQNLSPLTKKVIGFAALAFAGLAAYTLYTRRRPPSNKPSHTLKPILQGARAAPSPSTAAASKASPPPLTAPPAPVSAPSQPAVAKASPAAAAGITFPPGTSKEVPDPLALELFKGTGVDNTLVEYTQYKISLKCPKQFHDDFKKFGLVIIGENAIVVGQNQDTAEIFEILSDFVYYEQSALNLAKLIVARQEEPMIIYAQAHYKSQHLTATPCANFTTLQVGMEGNFVYLSLGKLFTSQEISAGDTGRILYRTLSIPYNQLQKADYDGSDIQVRYHWVKP